ncbi:MAG: glycosyltransferase [Dehalococcoidia bacterium]|nr:glycosyltransferase [Dehalococcoidia bacterium]
MSSSQPRLLFVAPAAPPQPSEIAEFARGLGEAYQGPFHLIAHQEEASAGPEFVDRLLAGAEANAGWAQVVHLTDATLGHLAPRLAGLTGAPVVLSVHGDDLPRASAEAMATLRAAASDPRVTVVATCATVAREVERHLRIAPRVITPGANVMFWGKITTDRRHVDEFRRDHLDLPLGVRLILSRGALLPRRGVAWFAREVLPRLPEDVRYVIAGDGADAATVRTLDDPRVLWSPIRLPNETAALFYCVDLAVFPGLPSPDAPEGYRIDAAEASSAGAPVLLADIEGNADTAEELGLMTVPAGDAAAWARAVIAALDQPPAHRRPAIDWGYVGLQYLGLYREVADLPA